MVIEEEWLDMVQYAKTYLNLVQEDSQTIWWKLADCTNSKKWVNVLALIELVFCLPMSNGHLEQVFSTLKLIKCDRRTSLGEDYLDNYLEQQQIVLPCRIGIQMELCNFGGKLSNVEQCKIQEHHHIILKKILTQVVQLLMSLIIWT